VKDKTTNSDIKKTIRLAVINGIFAQIYSTLTGIGGTFITKAAVILNATPMQFSLLNGITQISNFFQLYAVQFSRNVTSHKAPCIRFATVGRLFTMLLGVAFAITFPTLAIYFFLTILLITAILESISGNMWLAWISNMVPKRIRGRFLSFRMQVQLLFGLIIGYLFSFIIDLFEKAPGSWQYDLLQRFNLVEIFGKQHLPLALSVVFILGTIAGLIALLVLNRQPERPIKRKDDANFSIFEPFKNSDFRKLLRFGLWWMFAIGVGSSFWGPYMLRVLHMSLVEMQLYSMISSVFMLVGFRYWGKIADRFGNKTVMKICVFLGFINPSLWLFMTEANYVFIWFEAVTSGLMWSGANLVAVNFVLAIAPRGHEQHWSAVYSAMGGLMMLATIMLSGIFYPPYITIGTVTLHPEQVLFAITGILRLSAEIPLHFVNEPKAVRLRDIILGVRS